MPKYMVGMPAISNRIYAGRVTKDGSMSDIRTDVTNDAILCVMAYLVRNKSHLGMDSVDGEVFGKMYRLTVTELSEDADSSCAEGVRND